MPAHCHDAPPPDMTVVLFSLILLPFKMLLLPRDPCLTDLPRTDSSFQWMEPLNLWPSSKGTWSWSSFLQSPGAAGFMPIPSGKGQFGICIIFILKHLKCISPRLKMVCSCYLPKLSTISLRVYVIIFTVEVICAHQHSRK